MGEVYRADDLKLGQSVALKFLPRALADDAKILDSLYNEVRQARRVSHRHVCRVHDVSESDGQPFLSMEFIEGEDLGALLRQIGRFPGDKGIDLARQLFAGLAAAHDEGLLHLDLKPGNLMVDRRGNLRVTDFGLARLADAASDPGRRAGTPAYMAPEQVLGRELSPQTDIYAAGLVLYEVFTGRRVHGDRAPREIADWHRDQSNPEAPTTFVPNLDGKLEEIILNCLHPDPSQRPASAGAVLDGLDAFGGAPLTQSKREKEKDPPSKSGKSLAALMFTDIVGSVGLQQRLGTDEYTRFVGRHDEVFKECLEDVSEVSILNETGDGFLVRFADPADAVNTALRLQARLGGEEVAGQPLRVRIGLNMGVVTEMTESLRGERRAVGMPINIAARVMDLAGGGQILMTRSVYDDARHYVREHPDAASSGALQWMAHGSYHFKGGDEPLDIYEVGVEGAAPLTAPADSDKAWRGTASGRPSGESAATEDAPEAEPITVDDIERSDVIISYAPVDDRPLAAGSEGWVTRFHRNLSVRLEQLCGEEVNVLRCPRQPDKEIPDSVIPSVGRVKTMVPIVSPPFVKSDKCCRVVEAFGTGDPDTTIQKELLKAVKTPVSRDEIPAKLEPVLGGCLDYNFYDEDDSGRLREFDEAFGTDAQKRYYERVYDLAFEVSKNVKAAKRRREEVESAPSSSGVARTVFLAEATSDLQEPRDRLRRELLDQGHTVLPDKSLPMVAEELDEALAGYLGRCDFAIHFVGGRYGWIPDGASESLAVLQNRAAAKSSADAGLNRVVWVPRDVEAADERQVSFLQDLAEDPEYHRGAEVIRDTIENLKGYIRERWQAEEEAKRKAEEKEKEKENAAAASAGSPAAATPSEVARVYLICDQRDETAVEPIEDYLFDQGIEVLLPGFEGDESEISEVHWGNLADCDAALVYYGAAGKAWVDYKLRELVKATGYREGKPIGLQAVYVAPPFDRRKERFRSLSATVVKQEGDGFEPGALEEFVREVKGG